MTNRLKSITLAILYFLAINSVRAANIPAEVAALVPNGGQVLESLPDAFKSAKAGFTIKTAILSPEGILESVATDVCRVVGGGLLQCLQNTNGVSENGRAGVSQTLKAGPTQIISENYLEKNASSPTIRTVTEFVSVSFDGSNVPASYSVTTGSKLTYQGQPRESDPHTIECKAVKEKPQSLGLDKYGELLLYHCIQPKVEGISSSMIYVRQLGLFLPAGSLIRGKRLVVQSVTIQP